MKGCILSNEPLKANRRGIVVLSSTSEKPVISAELLENCRGGMSYASISKKLGIDPSKEEVLSVFKILKEVGDDFLDVESEDIIIPRQYPTPLWFMWNSELDVIAQASVPDVNDILSSSISSRIIERLGEDAADKIASFLDVNQIMVEEVGSSLSSADRKSNIGKVLLHSNHFPKKVISCRSLFSDLGIWYT